MTLAEELNGGVLQVQFLGPCQFLKHALGLAVRCNRNFHLIYLYYYRSVEAAEQHWRETRRFSARVQGDFRFEPFSY